MKRFYHFITKVILVTALCALIVTMAGNEAKAGVYVGVGGGYGWHRPYYAYAPYPYYGYGYPYGYSNVVILDSPPVAYAPAAPVAQYAPPPAQATNYCREYQADVHVGNQIQKSYGTACLQPDGSWQIMN